ncbi:PAS domain-containing protein [Pedobacter sp. Leaf132]|uniref:PAS domain-containing protein n=1 Tax=Pedobacter sp. Leaf132 TaxID=2876557 RepID=UPI001E369D5C|nr:PAS domain-containing protein [Pedobacter sp. Leaf132]
MNPAISSERRLAALLCDSADFAFYLSPDGQSRHDLNVTSLPLLVCESYVDWRQRHIHIDDIDAFNEHFSKALNAQHKFEFEHRVMQEDDSIGWSKTTILPIRDESGEVLEWFGTTRNISGKKEAETAVQLTLRKAEEQQILFDTITSTTPDLIYVFQLDYRFSYANKALLEMWGKSWEEAIGRSLIENGYETWHAEMHEREIDEIIKTGKPIRGEVDFPHASLGKRVYDYILTPVFDHTHKVIAISGVTLDVTLYKAQQEEKNQLSLELSNSTQVAEKVNDELMAAHRKLSSSQNKLNEANLNLNLIINMLPASIVVIRGYDLIVEMINESNLKYWNKTSEEVVGKKFLDILPDLAEQPFAAQLRKVIDTGEVIDVKESPVLFTMEDGHIRETFVDYTYQPLYGEQGNRNGVLVMSFEITERVNQNRLLDKYLKESTVLNESLHNLNAKLSASEARFKFFIEKAPVAIGILRSRELIVETANEKILEVWGKTDRIIGLPLALALPEIKGQPFLGMLDNVFTSGQPIHASEIRAMLEHEGFMKEIFFNMVYQPIKDHSEQVTDILVVASDVTEQVHARRVVEKSEQHFKKLSDLIPAKIYNALPNGEVTFFNQHWLDFSGLDFEQMRASGYQELIHPDDLVLLQKGLDRAAQSGKAFSSEIRFKNIHGTYIWHLYVSSPILDEDQQITMWVGSATDIHALKEEEQRKSDFIAIVSHELKTPLTSMKAYIQVLQLKAKALAIPFATQALDGAERQVLKMTEMIDGFLNLSRLENGKLRLDFQKTDAQQLVEGVIKEFQAIDETHHIQYLCDKSVYITVDPVKLGHVINNLISNAIKYSPIGSLITIDCTIDEHRFVFSIKDRGIGIPQQDLPHLFERFFRVESNRTSTVSGFGIGLYLSAEIIRGHGGNIWAESEVDKGSIFSFEIPIANLKISY